MNKDLLTLKEAGQYLDKSGKAVHNCVMRREIPFRKRVKKLVLDRVELDKFVSRLPGITFEDVVEKSS